MGRIFTNIRTGNGIALLFLLLVGMKAHSQYTAIPDANFEQALIDSMHDDVLDGQVATSSISGITYLAITSKNISDLTGLGDFTALENLYCTSNLISEFHFPTLQNLKRLEIRFNNLTELDLAIYPLLEFVNCRGNHLTEITLDNPALTQIECSFNAQTSLDVSNCPALAELYVYNNPLTSLVMGSITSLQTLFCGSTNLPSVDLRHQPNLTYMSAVNSPLLLCILVDDIAVVESYPQWSKDYGASYSDTDCELRTMIPDENFEQALIDFGYDDIIDGRILTNSISGITTLDVSNLDISDLTGIQDFTALTTLDCSHNQISTLNINSLFQLETLNASYNTIEWVDTYSLNALTHLELQHNLFIQSYMPNSSLVYTDLSYNNIESFYYDNSVTEYLDISHNNIGIIYYLNLPAAATLNMSYNVMEEVDLGDLSQMVMLDFSNNQLTGAVLPAMPMLETLHCENNMLTRLNLRNKPLLTAVDATQNQLSCILVGDVEAAEAQTGWQKDDTAAYALLCDPGPYTLIPDPIFEQVLINMNLDEIIDGQVATANITGVEELYLSELGISDLTGIEDFTSLQNLDVSYNQLTTLNLNGLTELLYLGCNNNLLTQLDLTGIGNLEELDCYENQLQSLDVSQCGNLEYLYCSDNELVSLTLTTDIYELDCGSNQLTSLNLEGMVQLSNLYCYSNNLQSLDISQADLFWMDCSDNALTCIKVANVADANNSWFFSKDDEAVYSTDCPGLGCELTMWDGNQWTPSLPDSTKQLMFTADYDITSDLDVCAINVTGGVTVNVSSGVTVTVHGPITVAPSSELVFENNANLLQSDTVINSGDVTVKRDAMVRRQDYVYWSSPVSGQNLLDFSPFTLINRFYTLDEAANNFAWADPAVNTFVPANGYMVRAPNNYADFPAPAQLFTGTFKGVPNNGNIDVPITYDGQGYNLIGNPYPSPIDASAFLAATPGTIYFWTHRVHGAESGTNYATYNLMGGTAAATGGEVPNGLIQTGQAFILQVEYPGTATFTNEMRVANSDGQFYRGITSDKHRFWLNLGTPQSGINQILIGYAEGATQGFDNGIDGRQIENGTAISSRIDGLNYVIQGRAMPFDNNDVVPLSLNVATAGTYVLSIDHSDGLFADGQSIFLRDNLTGTIHDFASGAYSFASAAGNFASRFEIVYANTTLGTVPVEAVDSLVIYNENNLIHINSGKAVMDGVKIFDVRGRLIYEKSNIASTTTTLSDFVSEKQVVLVRITADNGAVVTKKYVY
jgi:Leucine-rich repeat (LRR) protein